MSHREFWAQGDLQGLGIYSRGLSRFPKDQEGHRLAREAAWQPSDGWQGEQSGAPVLEIEPVDLLVVEKGCGLRGFQGPGSTEVEEAAGGGVLGVTRACPKQA